MLRLILGLVKGVVIGGAIGYGAFALNMRGGLNWLTFALVGGMVGMLVGQPIWAHLRNPTSTIFTPILKAIVGGGIAVGMYAIVAKAWGGFDLSLAEETRRIYDWQHIMGAAIGGLYGAFVELDDAADALPKPTEPKK